LRAEGFSCSLEILYEGIGISIWLFLIKKGIKTPAVVFSKFLVIKTLDPDPDSLKMLNPDPQH
jgi:hypothetical protein